MSVSNRSVIKVLLSWRLVLSVCFLEFAVGIGAFVRLSEIFAFLSFMEHKWHKLHRMAVSRLRMICIVLVTTNNCTYV